LLSVNLLWVDLKVRLILNQTNTFRQVMVKVIKRLL